MHNDAVAEKIKDYLKENGIKISWLSEETKVNWNDRLLGRTQIKVDDLQKAAEALNVQASYFLD